MGFLAFSIDPDLSEVTEAAARMCPHFNFASGTSRIMGPWHQHQVPDTIYLDASGRVVAFDRGEQRREHFEERVKALLPK